jgi:hypothetical protein
MDVGQDGDTHALSLAAGHGAGPDRRRRPSPRPPTSHCRIARELDRRPSQLRHDDETVVVEPSDSGVAELDRPAAKGHERASRVHHLLIEVAALPGDETPAHEEQRKRELDEVGERTDGARGHGRPTLPMARVPRQFLRPRRRHAHPRCDPDRLDRDAEECRLLPDRVGKDGALERRRDRERDPRKAAAAAKVQERRDLMLDEDRPSGEAVDDVAQGDRCRLANRGQVDRGVPGQEQANVIVDRPPRFGLEAQPKLAEAGVEGGVVVGR